MIRFVYNNHIASNLLHEITKTKQINCLYVIYVYEPLRPHTVDRSRCIPSTDPAVYRQQIMYYLIEHNDTY